MEIEIANLGGDATPRLRAAMETLRREKGEKKLVFAPGRHDFWPDQAEEELLFTSNNDSGLKRVAFNIAAMSGLEIDGQGAAFVFHGQTLPFAIRNSDQVTLRNFSLDFQRPFHNEATIVATGEGFVDLKFDREEFPYDIVDGKLLFRQEDGAPFASGRILEFDAAGREPALMIPQNYDFQLKPLTEARELPGGIVRLFAAFAEPRPRNGNKLCFGGIHRNCPGIFCDRSSNLRLEDLTIHHSGGMAFIAQRCENVRLERYVVTPSRGRMVSATGDATHFVNCKGEVELLDCRFENQLDDATNVHGIYARIEKAMSSRELEASLVHHQQRGFRFIEAGDVAEIIDAKTLLPYFKAPVKEARYLNSERVSLLFDEPLPELKPGDSVGNATWGADLRIIGCDTRGNRARGFLISTPGAVVVEGNTFHNEGPAILIEGDANYWFESGAVRDVLIKGNKFENCNYNYRGRAVIQISPGVSKDIAGPVPYHKNIRVEDNEFTTFSEQILYASCVDGLAFAGNRIELGDAYPAADTSGETLLLERCVNVRR